LEFMPVTFTEVVFQKSGSTLRPTMSCCSVLLVLVAVSLIVVDARVIVRRRDEEYHVLGGYREIDASSVPDDIKTYAVETMIEQLSHHNGIRFVAIHSAKSQTVAGSNYELAMQFDVTDCEPTESREKIDDETECPTTDYMSCTVTVHRSLQGELKLLGMSCVL